MSKHLYRQSKRKNSLVLCQLCVLGWHALRLCEGRGEFQVFFTPIEDSGRATQFLNFNFKSDQSTLAYASKILRQFDALAVVG